ncbi:UNVERIFIED_CONTAM: putative inorganic phosphate transporter 1-9 [Sesamum calycinum]|uniref:Inorganic phosphate transporter 1-9 n=1 Tax=Sesamum calycinum TaxID=2727403 RepID=A0AAW2IXU3_9LAMI
MPHQNKLNAFQEAFHVAKLQAIIAICSTIPGYYATVYFIDRIGRVKIQMMGFLFMGLCLLAIGIPYIGKIGAIIGSVGFLWASRSEREDGYGKGIAMTASLVMLGVVCVVGIVVTHLFTFETMGRSLEENEKEDEMSGVFLEEYFEAAAVSPVLEEQTLAANFEGNYPHWSNELHMDWVQRMIFYEAGLSYFFFFSRCGGSYDYELGLADRFYNVVPDADQPLWNDCIQSQLAYVTKDYITKKLIKDLCLPVGKIDEYKNSCMMYPEERRRFGILQILWYTGYTDRGRDSRRKKSSYVVLRYLPLAPRLERLYSFRETAEHTCGMPHIRQRGVDVSSIDTKASNRCVLGIVDKRVATVVDGVWVKYHRVMDVRFVCMTQGHSSCSIVGRRATLITIDSFLLSTIPIEGMRKPSRRIVSRIKLHIRG